MEGTGVKRGPLPKFEQDKKESSFAYRLKCALEKRGMKQSKLCEMTGINKSAMSQYVNGAFEPRRDRVEQIAKALNVSEAWLMGYAENRETTETEIKKAISKTYPERNGGKGVLMLENANVTLPLSDFDELREEGKAFREIAQSVSSCFKYFRKENPEPEECKNCGKKIDCGDCEIYEKYLEFDEYLTVDITRLIAVAKEYALYGKDVETDIDETDIEKIPVVNSVPAQHGRWIFDCGDEFADHYHCDQCGNEIDTCVEIYTEPTPNYCSNCGAKMDGTEAQANE